MISRSIVLGEGNNDSHISYVVIRPGAESVAEALLSTKLSSLLSVFLQLFELRPDLLSGTRDRELTRNPPKGNTSPSSSNTQKRDISCLQVNSECHVSTGNKSPRVAHRARGHKLRPCPYSDCCCICRIMTGSPDLVYW